MRIIQSLVIPLTAALMLGPTARTFGQPEENPFGVEPADETRLNLSAQFDKLKQEIYDLQQRLIPLLRRGEGDAKAAAEAAALEKEIALRSKELAELARLEQEIVRNKAQREVDPFSQPPSTVEKRRQEAIREEFAAFRALEASRQQLVERERQVAELSKQLADLERQRELPPLKDAEIKVFKLVNTTAPQAAATVESIFGVKQLRIGVDERSNSLVVAGEVDALKVVEALLMRLDESENDEARVQEPSGDWSSKASRSLLLRVFWLADGLPKGEGQPPENFLPVAVINALDKLGLEGPRLVSQTVNALAVGDEGAVDFSTNVPAIVLKQPANLMCKGRMRPVIADRAGVEMEINVSGQMINCQLSGSLATPLGHYMVLGTANSVIGDPATMAGMYDGMGMYSGRGMEMGGRGMMGRGYGRGGFGGEYGGAPAADPAPPGGEGAAAPVEEPPAAPKYNTSRFAFVVQVIEGESYAAEK